MKLKSTDTLEVLLAGAITTSQCPLIAAYADVASDSTTCAPNSTDGQTNSTTPVTWVGSPATGYVRQIAYLSCYNADTASVTVTLRINNGTTTRILRKVTLSAGESFAFNSEAGFAVFSSDGTPKGGAVTSVNGMTGAVTVSFPVTSVNGSTGAVFVASPIQIACSDETTALTTGNKVNFRVAQAFTCTGVRASLSTAQVSGSLFTVNVKKNGTTIFSTKVTLDNTEKTSVTAATAAVLTTSPTLFADDDEVAIDIDQIGDGTAKGLKVTLLGHPT
jgi:hypothetical protein